MPAGRVRRVAQSAKTRAGYTPAARLPWSVNKISLGIRNFFSSRAQVLNQHGRGGLFGLRGVRERSMGIRGQLEVWTERKTGTEVELTIPASLAYKSHASRRCGLIKSKVGMPS